MSSQYKQYTLYFPLSRVYLNLLNPNEEHSFSTSDRSIPLLKLLTAPSLDKSIPNLLFSVFWVINTAQGVRPRK